MALTSGLVDVNVVSVQNAGQFVGQIKGSELDSLQRRINNHCMSAINQETLRISDIQSGDVSSI